MLRPGKFGCRRRLFQDCYLWISKYSLETAVIFMSWVFITSVVFLSIHTAYLNNPSTKLIMELTCLLLKFLKSNMPKNFLSISNSALHMYCRTMCNKVTIAHLCFINISWLLLWRKIPDSDCGMGVLSPMFSPTPHQLMLNLINL